MSFTEYIIENQQEFNQTIEDALRKVSDLRPAFSLIATDFYRSEKAIFKLKSPGAYKDLKPKYKIRKAAKYGNAYPILRASGRLESSITKQGANENITLIGARFLVLGTSVPYGIFHQVGTNKMAARPFVFVGPESSKFALRDRSGQGGRLTRWTNIIEEYVKEVTENS